MNRSEGISVAVGAAITQAAAESFERYVESGHGAAHLVAVAVVALIWASWKLFSGGSKRTDG